MSPTPTMRRLFLGLALIPVMSQAVEVQMVTAVARAVEPEAAWGTTAIDGVLLVTRSNSSGSLTVTLRLEDASNAFPRGAVLGTDYRLYRRDPVTTTETAIVPAGDGSFPLLFAEGRAAWQVLVRPLANGRLTGGMQVPFSIQPGPYVVSLPGSARIDVADSAASVRFNFGSPVAYERNTAVGSKAWVGLIGNFQSEIRVAAGTIIDGGSPTSFGSTFQFTSQAANQVDYEVVQSTVPVTTALTALPNTTVSYNVGAGWRLNVTDDRDVNRKNQTVIGFTVGAFTDAISPGDILAIGDHPYVYRIVQPLPTVKWDVGTVDLDYTRPEWTVYPPLWRDLTEGEAVYRIGKSGAIIDNQLPIVGLPVPAAGGAVSTYINVIPYDNLSVSGGRPINIAGQSSNDYVLISPGTTDVVIADNDSVADIVRVQDATAGVRPGIARVAFTKAFPKNIDVEYTVTGPATDPLGNAVPSSGTVTLLQGQTSVDIPVVAKAGVVNGPGGSNATIVLSSSTDFVMTSSSSASQNPSATVTILDNQATANITPDTTATLRGNGREGVDTAVPMSFRVSLTPPVGSSTLPSEMTIEYEVDSASTAVPGVNYSALSGALVVSGATGYGIINVPVQDDEVRNPNLTLTLRLKPGTSYNIGGYPAATAQIVDNAPVVSLAVADGLALEPATGTEVGHSGRFVVSYPGVPAGTPLNRNVLVSYLVSGTAQANVHYAPLTGTAIIPSGSLSVPITIDPLYDPDFTPSRTVVLTLQDATPDIRGLAYGLASASSSVRIVDARETPPTPPANGASSAANGGGCGAGAAGLLLGSALAGLGLRRRRR
jgi:hypothetical protein